MENNALQFNTGGASSSRQAMSQRPKDRVAPPAIATGFRRPKKADYSDASASESSSKSRAQVQLHASKQLSANKRVGRSKEAELLIRESSTGRLCDLCLYKRHKFYLYCTLMLHCIAQKLASDHKEL